jgi:hypothetical protein
MLGADDSFKHRDKLERFARRILIPSNFAHLEDGGNRRTISISHWKNALEAQDCPPTQTLPRADFRIPNGSPTMGLENYPLNPVDQPALET